MSRKIPDTKHQLKGEGSKLLIFVDFPAFYGQFPACHLNDNLFHFWTAGSVVVSDTKGDDSRYIHSLHLQKAKMPMRATSSSSQPARGGSFRSD